MDVSRSDPMGGRESKSKIATGQLELALNLSDSAKRRVIEGSVLSESEIILFIVRRPERSAVPS